MRIALDPAIVHLSQFHRLIIGEPSSLCVNYVSVQAADGARVRLAPCMFSILVGSVGTTDFS